MKLPSGGGWHAIGYTLAKARDAGGYLKMYQALRTKNTCKTCALGMGGQQGGMVNEIGHFPEVCKKSLQAMAADMQKAVPAALLEKADWSWLEGLSPRQLETSGRLTTPLYAGPDDSGYRAMSWEECLTRMSGKMAATPASESFFYFSGRSSNEAGFLLQLFARMYGTNNVNNCSFYCHQASGVGLTGMFGNSTGTVTLEDLDATDLMILVGANPASNHPRFMRTLMELKRRGGKVIVVNPVVESGLVRFSVPSDPRSLLFGTHYPDVYVQPHIGGDIAFFASVAQTLLERNGADRDFLSQHTQGWEAWEDQLRAFRREDLIAASGVAQADVESVVELMLRSKATVFAWAMGITHHAHGVNNVRMLANLALLRGMVARPGAGLLPLRGHSNIQGMGTVGVTPKLKDAIFQRLEAHFGVNLPTAPGLETMGSMERAAAGGIRFALCLGGNLYGSNPDAAFAKQALHKIDQVVYLSTALNTGHVHGRGKETFVLPVRVRDEETQPTTQESMFSFVRLSDGGPARHHGPWGEVEVIAALAERVLGKTGPIDWAGLRSHDAIRAIIAAVVPGLDAIKDIAQSKTEFTIPGRSFATPAFNTPDGRAAMHPISIPTQLPLGPQQFRLMTVRSEGQFNTVVYEDDDRYRGQKRRDIILLHPDDIARLGLHENQRVTIRSSTGTMPNILIRPFQIRPGNAVMYYPEANILIPRTVDPESGTPAFKNVLIDILV